MDNLSIAHTLTKISDREVRLLVNESTITWQCSYVWFVIGCKSDFPSLEEFYLNLIMNSAPFESRHEDELPWKIRSNKSLWANGLKIKLIEGSELLNVWHHAIQEAVSSDETDEDFNITNIPRELDILNAWSIRETGEPRFAVGLNLGYVAETKDHVIYLESHIES